MKNVEVLVHQIKFAWKEAVNIAAIYHALLENLVVEMDVGTCNQIQTIAELVEVNAQELAVAVFART